MYVLSEQLKKNGFNIDFLHRAILRNGSLLKFNTLEFYCIYLILEDLDLKIEGESISIKAGHAVFLGPHRNIEFLGAPKDNNIYVIAFSATFFERSKKDSIFLNSKVFYNHLAKFTIAPYFGSNEYIETILIQRLRYFYEKDKSLYIYAAHNVIENLILDAMMHIDSNEDLIDEKLDFVSKINYFNTLLQRDYKTYRDVAYYASQLHISPKKLTSMTSYLYGKTAKQVIIQKVISESLINLRNTRSTISEISYEMGFKCESVFTHFISKHTGKSPSALRTGTNLDSSD